MTDLSIVIVSFETCSHLVACLDKVARAIELHPDLEVETLVVDNGSRDGSVHAAMASPAAPRVLSLVRNRGFAAAANLGLRQAQGRHLLLLNSDAEIESDVLARGVEILEETPDIGVLGISLVHPSGRRQRSVHAIPDLQTEILPDPILRWMRPRGFALRNRPTSEKGRVALRKVEAVRGAVFFIRGELLEKVGLLDEGYFFFLEETDYCWRAQSAGYHVYHASGLRAKHWLGSSSKRHAALATRIEYHRSLYRFLEKRSGGLVATSARELRTVRTAVGLIGLAAVALGSPAARARLTERWGLLLWHLRGCPRQPDLAQTLQDEGGSSRGQRRPMEKPGGVA